MTSAFIRLWQRDHSMRQQQQIEPFLHPPMLPMLLNELVRGRPARPTIDIVVGLREQDAQRLHNRIEGDVIQGVIGRVRDAAHAWCESEIFRLSPRRWGRMLRDRLSPCRVLDARRLGMIAIPVAREEVLESAAADEGPSSRRARGIRMEGRCRLFRRVRTRHLGSIGVGCLDLCR